MDRINMTLNDEIRGRFEAATGGKLREPPRISLNSSPKETPND